MDVRRLSADDLWCVGQIDRSEHVEVEYAVIDGQLTERPASMTEIPGWDPTGSGPHSVEHEIEFCASSLAAGAVMLGDVRRSAALPASSSSTPGSSSRSRGWRFST